MSEVVKISDETLAVFRKLFVIDQSLKIVASDVVSHTVTDDEGNESEIEATVVRTKSSNRTMIARVEIPEVFPRDFHVYDLREFNAVVNIVSEPSFDFSSDKYVVIKSSDGKQKLRYIEADASLIESYIDKDLPLPAIDLDVTVTGQQLSSVLKAAQTMKLAYVGLIGDGETVRLVSFNKNDGDEMDTNNFSIEVGESDVEFRMFYKLDVHKVSVLEGEGSLRFEINAKKKVSRVTTESGKTFWIALDTKSTFNG